MQKLNRKPCPAIADLPDDINYDTFRKAIRPCLLKMSKNHCSYCDTYFWNTGILEVEHFKRRADYPELEREYSNLYMVCKACNNRKRHEYPTETEPIRPDDRGYKFEKHFHFEPDTGEILLLNKEDKSAEQSLDYLNLNNNDLAEARRIFWKEWITNGVRPGMSFRFINGL